MAILKPSGVTPNNIAKDATDQIVISWKNLGDRHYYYQIRIYQSDTNELVLDTQKVNDMNSFYVITPNTLTNGVTYKYQIIIWNQNDEQAISEWVVFKCSSTPSCYFTNISNNQEILNSTYLAQGRYVQCEDVPIKSWNMILYDKYDNIIATSGNVYNNEIEYQFEGLNNDTTYKIELQVRSQDDLMDTTGKIQFHVRYEVPTSAITLEAENINEQAGVRLSWKVIQIIGQVIGGFIEYKDGGKIDLRNGKIEFRDGMSNFKDFSLKLWLEWVDLKNIVRTKSINTSIGTVKWTTRDSNTELLRMKSPLGDLWLEWEYEDDTQGRFYLKKNIYKIPYHIKTDLLQFENGDTVYVGIGYDGGLCDLYVEKVVM